MAKRPTQSLDVVGQSLLSQQATRRKEYEKDKKKDERWMKLLGVAAAGQSLVGGALKRRTQEIKEAGRISKLQSKVQVANFNSLTPIYQAIDPYVDYTAFEDAYATDPSSFNSLKNHLNPYMKNYVKQITGKDLSEEAFQAQYNLLENNMVKEIAKNAFNTKDQFKKGITGIAEEVGVNKDAMWQYFTGLDINTLDGIKAQKLNSEVKNFGTTFFNRGNMRNMGNALTFGWIKEQKGSTNIFKDFDEDWRPLSKDIRNVFDTMNINTTIAEQIKANAPTLKDRVAEAAGDTKLLERMNVEYGTLKDRISDGSWFWKGDESPDRYSKFKEDRIDNLVSDLNETQNAQIKQRILLNTGALSNMIGDPRETEFKKQFIETYSKEFKLEVGSADYADFVNSLKDVKTRDQLAMNFVLSQVATDRFDGWGGDLEEGIKVGEQSFVYDFDKMDQLLRPSFMPQDGKVVATEVYNSADATDKQILYRSYVKSILGNYQKTKMNTQQLTSAAQQFMQTIPPPGGQKSQDILNSILLELKELDEYID
jgi:hypothetical protein